jgi:cation diffusion facilitator family transporter
MAEGQPMVRRLFRIQLVVLVVGVALLVGKFLAWWLTNSNAILTDALESIINVAAGGFALYSIWLSAQPSDENHPYGHGKIEYLAAGVEGSLIVIAGLLILFKSVYNLVNPQLIGQLDLGMVLVAGSGVVNYVMGVILSREGKRAHSLILQADGAHLRSDAWSSLGLLVGLGLLMLTGQPWIDSVTAMLFGGVILVTGFRLVRSSVAGIMDEADHGLISEVVGALQDGRHPNWIDLHNFRVIKYGSTLHIDCHLTLPWYFQLVDAHEEVARMEAMVRAHCARPVELFIHSDPCEPPHSCRICTKSDCAERKHPFEKSLPWTLARILPNKRHHD